MTNINCAKDCDHQVDGKCCYDKIRAFDLNFYNTEHLYCVYYTKRDKKKPDTTDIG